MPKRHRLLWFGFFALGGLMLAAPPAGATVLLYLSNAELTERSSHVVQAVVLWQGVVTDRGSLWTDTHLQVKESLKGPALPGQILLLRQPGGETPRLGLRVEGTARFFVGEEVLVFARPVPGRHFLVPTGMALGKYRIVPGGSGVEAKAVRTAGGASVATWGARGLIIQPGWSMTTEDELPLSTLVGTIRARLRKGGGR